MDYIIIGLSYEQFRELHDFYLPRTIITSSLSNKHTNLIDITLTDHAIIKINGGDITIDLGAKLYTIPKRNYKKLIVE